MNAPATIPKAARPLPVWKSHWKSAIVVVAIIALFVFLRPRGSSARTRALATMKEAQVSLSLQPDGTLDAALFRNKPGIEGQMGNLSWAFDQLRRFPEVKIVRTEFLMPVNVATLRELHNLESFSVTDRAEFDQDDFNAFAGMKNLHSLELRGDKLSAKAIERLKDIPKLKSLRLSGGSWGGEGMAQLANFPALEHLSLEGAARDWKEPLQLGACRRLKSLRLVNFTAKPDDLQELELLVSLEELSLTMAHLEPHHFDSLKKLPKLKSLRIAGGVGSLDDCAAIIGSMPALESLAIADHSNMEPSKWLTVVGLGRIAASQSIRELEIYGAAVGDEGVKAIAKMTRIKNLTLNRVGATEASFDSIRKIEGLEQLSIYEPVWQGKGIPQSALAKLREELARKKVMMTFGWGAGGYW